MFLTIVKLYYKPHYQININTNTLFQQQKTVTVLLLVEEMATTFVNWIKNFKKISIYYQGMQNFYYFTPFL